VQTMLPPETEGTSRRHFFIGAIYGLWALIAGALSAPAIVYLLFPPKARKTDEWVQAGDIARLAPNVPTEMTFRRNRVDGWKVTSEKSTAWVVKDAANRITAFGPQCTHLGCAYHWDDSKTEFLCPCHNSLFDAEGNVVSGPAPRPLDRYETKVEGTKLLIGRLNVGGERS
jgi:quinol---cytochrome c reductase iron-sulfur subunit, bacillus type